MWNFILPDGPLFTQERYAFWSFDYHAEEVRGYHLINSITGKWL